MIFILWLIFAVAVAVFASKRGRNVFGWFLIAAIISPLISIIILFLLPSKNSKKCPECKENILKEAIVCKHCGCRLFELETSPKISVSTSSFYQRHSSTLLALLVVAAMVIITNMFGIFK